MEKLEHFRKAWSGVEYNSKAFMCKDAIKALYNLEIHILKGWLENITPKTGTSRNVPLHRQLNNIINIHKCKVELIASILESFFYKGNADHSETKCNCPSSIRTKIWKKGKRFWNIWNWHISHWKHGYWRKWQTANNKWKQHINFNIRSNKCRTKTTKCGWLRRRNCNLRNKTRTEKRIDSWNDWSSEIITKSNSTPCVFSNISDLMTNFCLQRSFTFFSIALSLLYKGFINKDNNLFLDNFQLQPLNYLENIFINAVCQSIFCKLHNVTSMTLSFSYSILYPRRSL